MNSIEHSMRRALELFDEEMKKKAESNRKLFEGIESGLANTIELHVPYMHEATNKTSEKKSSEDQPRTSSTQCNERE